MQVRAVKVSGFCADLTVARDHRGSVEDHQRVLPPLRGLKNFLCSIPRAAPSFAAANSGLPWAIFFRSLRELLWRQH